MDWSEEIRRQAMEYNRKQQEEASKREREQLEANQRAYREHLEQQDRDRKKSSDELFQRYIHDQESRRRNAHSSASPPPRGHSKAPAKSASPRRKRRRLLLWLVIGGFVYWYWGKNSDGHNTSTTSNPPAPIATDNRGVVTEGNLQEGPTPEPPQTEPQGTLSSGTPEPMVWIGITMSPPPENAAEGVGRTAGVLVVNVAADSPADLAVDLDSISDPLQPGDVVTSVDGNPVASPDDIDSALEKYTGSAAMTFTIVRNGRLHGDVQIVPWVRKQD